jgi:hypothetical protein
VERAGEQLLPAPLADRRRQHRADPVVGTTFAAIPWNAPSYRWLGSMSSPPTSSDSASAASGMGKRLVPVTDRRQTALETGPISGVSITKALRGQAATLEQLRVDRQLDEALTRGPDPLHLAGIFGLDDKTAIRYANAARHLLESAAEQDAATGSA